MSAGRATTSSIERKRARSAAADSPANSRPHSLTHSVSAQLSELLHSEWCCRARARSTLPASRTPRSPPQRRSLPPPARPSSISTPPRRRSARIAVATLERAELTPLTDDLTFHPPDIPKRQSPTDSLTSTSNDALSIERPMYQNAGVTRSATVAGTMTSIISSRRKDEGSAMDISCLKRRKTKRPRVLSTGDMTAVKARYRCQLCREPLMNSANSFDHHRRHCADQPSSQQNSISKTVLRSGYLFYSAVVSSEQARWKWRFISLYSDGELTIALKDDASLPLEELLDASHVMELTALDVSGMSLIFPDRNVHLRSTNQTELQAWSRALRRFLEKRHPDRFPRKLSDSTSNVSSHSSSPHSTHRTTPRESRPVTTRTSRHRSVEHLAAAVLEADNENVNVGAESVYLNEKDTTSSATPPGSDMVTRRRLSRTLANPSNRHSVGATLPDGLHSDGSFSRRTGSFNAAIGHPTKQANGGKVYHNEKRSSKKGQSNTSLLKKLQGYLYTKRQPECLSGDESSQRLAEETTYENVGEFDSKLGDICEDSPTDVLHSGYLLRSREGQWLRVFVTLHRKEIRLHESEGTSADTRLSLLDCSRLALAKHPPYYSLVVQHTDGETALASRDCALLKQWYYVLHQLIGDRRLNSSLSRSEPALNNPLTPELGERHVDFPSRADEDPVPASPEAVLAGDGAIADEVVQEDKTEPLTQSSPRERCEVSTVRSPAEKPYDELDYLSPVTSGVNSNQSSLPDTPGKLPRCERAVLELLEAEVETLKHQLEFCQQRIQAAESTNNTMAYQLTRAHSGQSDAQGELSRETERYIQQVSKIVQRSSKLSDLTAEMEAQKLAYENFVAEADESTKLARSQTGVLHSILLSLVRLRRVPSSFWDSLQVDCPAELHTWLEDNVEELRGVKSPEESTLSLTSSVEDSTLHRKMAQQATRIRNLETARTDDQHRLSSKTAKLLKSEKEMVEMRDKNRRLENQLERLKFSQKKLESTLESRGAENRQLSRKLDVLAAPDKPVEIGEASSDLFDKYCAALDEIHRLKFKLSTSAATSAPRRSGSVDDLETRVRVALTSLPGSERLKDDVQELLGAYDVLEGHYEATKKRLKGIEQDYQQRLDALATKSRSRERKHRGGVEGSETSVLVEEMTYHHLPSSDLGDSDGRFHSTTNRDFSSEQTLSEPVPPSPQRADAQQLVSALATRDTQASRALLRRLCARECPELLKETPSHATPELITPLASPQPTASNMMTPRDSSRSRGAQSRDDTSHSNSLTLTTTSAFSLNSTGDAADLLGREPVTGSCNEPLSSVTETPRTRDGVSDVVVIDYVTTASSSADGTVTTAKMDGDLRTGAPEVTQRVTRLRSRRLVELTAAVDL